MRRDGWRREVGRAERGGGSPGDLAFLSDMGSQMRGMILGDWVDARMVSAWRVGEGGEGDAADRLNESVLEGGVGMEAGGCSGGAACAGRRAPAGGPAPTSLGAGGTRV